MVNNTLTEIFVLSTFTFALIIAAYDKLENFQNYKTRELFGCFILFSMISNFLFFLMIIFSKKTKKVP